MLKDYLLWEYAHELTDSEIENFENGGAVVTKVFRQISGTVKEVSLSNELLLKYLLENDPLSDNNCEGCYCFPICEGGCPYKRIYQKDSQERFCKAKREGIVEKLKRHIDYKYKNNKNQ